LEVTLMEITDRGTGRKALTGFAAVEIVNPNGQDHGYPCVEAVSALLEHPTGYKVLSAAYGTKAEAEAYLDGYLEAANLKTEKQRYLETEDAYLREQGML
jgi:hypothetical protein